MGRRTARDADIAGDVLEYFPEPHRTDSSAVAIYTLLAPVFVGMFVGALGFTELALPAMLAAAIGMYLYRRRSRRVPWAVLRVRDGVLHGSGQAFPSPVQIPLTSLRDVSLDTKTIQRVQEAQGGFPELRFINATVGPAVDTARIQLDTDDAPVLLSERYVSHLDATEWLNVIRRFLRRNGWTPADERPDAGQLAAERRKPRP